jgi:putative hydrolase of the HAD superfamily
MSSNKSYSIFFDIDDTLYDQYEPFRQAFKTTFDDQFDALNIEDLFIFSRAQSDKVFDMVQRGEMDRESMYAYRIGKAFEEKGIHLPKSDCLIFQRNYEQCQKNIHLSQQIKNLLTFLSQHNVEIGIISNGPERHQWFKIKNLGLEKWFNKKNIFISETVGYSKPSSKIFQYVEKQTSRSSDECIYIGDAFQIDVVGAKNANWKSIWFNRRHHLIPEKAIVKPDFVVQSELELSQLLLTIYHITFSFSEK